MKKSQNNYIKYKCRGIAKALMPSINHALNKGEIGRDEFYDNTDCIFVFYEVISSRANLQESLKAFYHLPNCDLDAISYIYEPMLASEIERLFENRFIVTIGSHQSDNAYGIYLWFDTREKQEQFLNHRKAYEEVLGLLGF
jgi:hypothetical protein